MTTSNNMQTVILKVPLHCEGCERRVKKAIWHIKGITSVDVDNNRERVTVTGFVDPARILKAVKKTGKPVELWKYQNGNKNLFGSQPLPTAAATPSSTSKGNKVNNSSSNEKYPGFTKQQQQLHSNLDRSRHPQPEYPSDADSEFESFPDTEFYGGDAKSEMYSHFKSPKSQKNDFYGDFKSPKSQKNDAYGQKNQKSDFYGDFKSPKNQQKNDVYSDFKSPSSQKSKPDLYDEFKSQNNHELKPQKNQKSGYYGDFKPPKEHQKPGKPKVSEFSHFGYDDENEFSHSRKSSNHSAYDGEKITPQAKSKNYTGGSHPEYDEYKKSGSAYGNHSNHGSHGDHGNHGNHSSHGNNHGNQSNHGTHGHVKSDYLTSTSSAGYDNEEKPFNQKKNKPQMTAKYVSFEDDEQPRYRPQQTTEVNLRAADRGHEQKFYTTTTYGQEQQQQQSYQPSYIYRIPATTGFTSMFSEENPNACSIM